VGGSVSRPFKAANSLCVGKESGSSDGLGDGDGQLVTLCIHLT
jgi:hypothetical protein